MDFYVLASVMGKKLHLLVLDPFFSHWPHRGWPYLKIRVEFSRGLQGPQTGHLLVEARGLNAWRLSGDLETRTH